MASAEEKAKAAAEAERQPPAIATSSSIVQQAREGDPPTDLSSSVDTSGSKEFAVVG